MTNPQAVAITLAPETRTDVRVSVPAEFTAEFFRGRSAATVEAYRRDLQGFVDWLRDVRGLPVETVDDAARVLFTGSHGNANGLAIGWRNHLAEDRGLAPASVNRKLAALRSLVAMGRTLGVVGWKLEVRAVESRAYRDTAGPGVDAVVATIAAAEAQPNPEKAARDVAILWLLFGAALRRIEVQRLDVADVDLRAGRLMILGKKRTEREPFTIPAEAVEALRRWLDVRGTEAGPLFVNLSRSHDRQRMTGRGVLKTVNALGAVAGVEGLRCHGLRHSAITAALDATNGDVRAVQRFSRHRDVRVLSVYDDNRSDLAGDVATLVAAKAVARRVAGCA